MSVSVCPRGLQVGGAQACACVCLQGVCWCCHRTVPGSHPPVSGQGSLCLPPGPGLCRVSSPFLAGWRWFSAEPQACLRFLGGGAGCCLRLVCRGNTRAPCQQRQVCRARHSPVLCKSLCFQSFLIVKCFKKATERKFPQDGNKRGRAAVTGSTGAPQREPRLRSLP